MTVEERNGDIFLLENKWVRVVVDGKSGVIKQLVDKELQHHWRRWDKASQI